jgi:hypothetical protein
MRSSIVLLTVVAAACGVNESVVDETAVDDQLEDGAELSASSRTFVGIRRDFRKCIAPLCGGYWVHDLNRVNLTEVYVSGLDFTGSGLSDEDQGNVELGLDEVVLRGKLGPKEPQFNTRPFIVSEAYRGMPGKPVGATDKFFKVQPVSIQCFRAPCPSLGAKKVNFTAQTLFHQLDLADVTAGLVDGKWLRKRATLDGAITSGTMVRRGEEQVLEASNVFLRLPEVAGPCPVFKLAACPMGQVRTYTRTADRCVVPAACVAPGVCAQYIPACGEGYSLSSWQSGTFGCPAYACDPNWVLGTQN